MNVRWVSMMAVVGVMMGACDVESGSTLHEHGAVASGGERDHDGDHDHDHDAEPHVSPERIAHVTVFHDENIGHATEVLGTVDVHSGMEHQDEALQRLRARAAALGADALIGVEYHHTESGPTHLSGLAVRFRDLINGRGYDVIGDISVDSEMGHDHDALGRLQARARDVHADLITDIHFVHGDDPHGHPQLSGRAIRFR